MPGQNKQQRGLTLTIEKMIEKTEMLSLLHGSEPTALPNQKMHRTPYSGRL